MYKLRKTNLDVCTKPGGGEDLCAIRPLGDPFFDNQFAMVYHKNNLYRECTCFEVHNYWIEEINGHRCIFLTLPFSFVLDAYADKNKT